MYRQRNFNYNIGRPAPESITLSAETVQLIKIAGESEAVVLKKTGTPLHSKCGQVAAVYNQPDDGYRKYFHQLVYCYVCLEASHTVIWS
jgi:hypothetical protein